MKRFLIAALFLAASLMVACGSADGGETPPPPTETAPSPTDTPPPPTDTPLPPTDTPPPPTDPPEAESDSAPGTRLSTVDFLPANGENNIVLLANVGDILIAGVEPGTDQDVALGLFYLTGSGTGELAAQVNEGPGFENLTYTFQVAGAYRLAIREIKGVGGQVVMRIASSPGVALTIAPHHQVEGKVETGGRVGVLHNGYAGRKVTFSAEPAPGYPELDLSLSIVALSDMGTTLLDVDDNGPGQGETAAFVPPADDEYYIVVEGKNKGTGVFNLTVIE